MKKLTTLFTTTMIALALLMAAPATMAGGKPDKVYVCHITSISINGKKLMGHVIATSVNAVDAHCNHHGVSDHWPNQSFKDAAAACEFEFDVDYDECFDSFLQSEIGAYCKRNIKNTGAVPKLCG